MGSQLMSSNGRGRRQVALVEESLPALLAGGADDLGERVLRATFEGYEKEYQPMLGALVGLVRSAIAHDDAASLLRQGLAEGGLVLLVEALGLPQPRLRAALVGCELFGLALARFVVHLEPIASADIETLVGWYGPTLQRYLTEPLPGDSSPLKPVP